jgi:hypothetical protein
MHHHTTGLYHPREIKGEDEIMMEIRMRDRDESRYR